MSREYFSDHATVTARAKGVINLGVNLCFPTKGRPFRPIQA